MSGGALMVVIGIAYLVFQKQLLQRSKLSGDSTKPAEDNLSRSLIGVQVSRIRSSARTFLMDVDWLHPLGYGCDSIKLSVT